MIDLNALLDADKRLKTGLMFVNENDFPAALAMFESVLDVDPVNISALCNSAFMALKGKDMKKAQFMIDTAMSIDPEGAHTLGIAALIAQETPNANKFDVARELFEKALKNDPRDITRHVNYAYMLQLVGDYKRALEIYTAARDINPLDLSVRFQRSMCLLTLAETAQQWQEALAEYEIRHLLYKYDAPKDGTPVYYGQEVDPSSTLLICNEQGIGDAVMCGRYVRAMKQKFKKVYFLCKSHWADLMWRVEGIDGVYTDLAQTPKCDYYVHCLSLLRATGYPVVQVSNAPYIRRNPNVDLKALGIKE